MGQSKNQDYYLDSCKDLVASLVNNGMSVRKAVRLMCEEHKLPLKEDVERHYRRIHQTKQEETTVDQDFEKAKQKKFDSKKTRFIFTWGQQNTPIHEQFLGNIEAYAEHIDADIHVIAGKYKNPTSLEASEQQKQEAKDDSNWHPRLRPYLDANRQNIHKYLSVLGDVKIQPTASTPLSGFNSITALESCIIGHPRVHLKSLPVLDGYPHKLLLTTGAITLPNYTESKAGAKGTFHHTLGFVVVELDGDIFHVRQVQCGEDGEFYDLSNYVQWGEVYDEFDEYPAMVFGDIHLGSTDEQALQVSFDIAKRFKVETIYVHDIFDGSSVNHHEEKNPFLLLEKEVLGQLDLKTEIDTMIDFFNSQEEFNFVAVRSNHDIFLDRWLCDTDWRKSPNKQIYITLAGLLASGKATKGVIPHVLESNCSNVKALGINDSSVVLDWELGIHGHQGASGSRGSITQFKTFNTKTITGHSHTPAREDGALVVGTLTKLRLSYNTGASSWLHSNVIIYPNGKASHVHIINGKYTTL